MKKIILSIIACITLAVFANAQNVNIPDANFKAYLVGNAGINTNGDTEIQISEANAFSGNINCDNLSISDMTGIEEFTSISQLLCHSNSIISLDLSQNTSLTTLWCHQNQLTSLNVANGNNANFTQFYAQNNSNLTCIQVDDVAYSTTNWTWVDAQISFNTSCPCTVNIPDANFKAYLVGNSSINTNGDTEIQCSEASTFTGSILCMNSNISDLTGIEAFTALTVLNCNNNSLTSLGISQNTVLTELHCIQNSISGLDLSQNLALTNVQCQFNIISSIDITANTAITNLRCNDNVLTSLNVANGNNTNFTYFNVLNNPNLICIQIDLGFTPTGWYKDATASYSDNCSTVLVSSITVQGQGGVSTITTNAGTLQMESSVLPTNADDMTYTWSVTNVSGSASIDANGLLTAVSNGVVDVIATANDASGITGVATITLSNQSVGIVENNGLLSGVEIYPNPVQNELFIDVAEEQINQLEIIDFMGRIVKLISGKQVKSLDVSNLTQGIYILKVSTEKGISTQQFIKK